MFSCWICLSLYNDIKEIFSHLRKIHSIKDNVNEIKCVKGCDALKCTYVKPSGTCDFGAGSAAEQSQQNLSADNGCSIDQHISLELNPYSSIFCEILCKQ